MTEAEQLQAIRNAIYAMVNALGAALPRTPEVVQALDALVASDMDRGLVAELKAARAGVSDQSVSVRLLNPNQCGNCQDWSWEHDGPVHPCAKCECQRFTTPDPDRTDENVPEPT